MSGGQPDNVTQTTKTELPAWMNERGADVAYRGSVLASQPFQPYTGQTVAPLTPQQQQAMGMAQQAIGNYNPALAQGNYAANAAGGAIMNSIYGQTPQSQGVNATAGNVAGADLNPYMNPFTQSVIDTSLADLERTRAGGIASNQAAATAAGAFGGSRHGVVDALTNEGAIRQAGQLSAGLNSANFNQAQQALIGDINRQAQTSQFNAAQGQQNNQFNAGMSNEALQRMLQGAGAFSDLSGRYGQLGTLQSALAGTDIERMLGIGNQLQDDTQFGLDRQYQEFLRQQEDPFRKLSAYSGAISGTPTGQTQSSTQPLTRNRTAGALGGAASGAAAGTAIMPGWGTAIGAVVGGLGGYFGS